MEAAKKERPSKLYRKILLAVSIASVLSVLTASSLLYFGYLGIAETEALTADRDRLVQLENSAAVMMALSRSVAEQVYSNSVITSNLIYPQIDGGAMATIAALKMFETYRQPLAHLDSIYIYNGPQSRYFVASEAEKRIVLLPDAPDPGIGDLLKRAQSLGQLQPIPRVLTRQRLGEPERQRKVYTFLYWTDAPVIEGIPLFVIVINMDALFFQAGLSDLSQDMRDSAFAIDRNGLVVLENPSHPFLSSLKDTATFELLQKQNQRRGTVSLGTGSQKVSLSFTVQPELGWKFVQTTSAARLEEKLSPLRDTVLLVVLAVLVLGMLLSFLLSNRLYAPLGSLEERLEEVSESRLRRLLLGESDARNAAVCREAGLEPEQPCYLFLVTLSLFKDFRRSNTYPDRIKIKAQIRSSGLAVLQTQGPSHGCAWDERTELLLLQTPTAETDVLALARQLEQTVVQNTGRLVHITTCRRPTLPPNLLDETAAVFDASQARLWTPLEQTLDVEDLNFADNQLFDYPKKAEQELLEHLRLGERDKALQALDRFVQAARPFRPAVLHSSLVRLASTVHTEIDGLARSWGRALQGAFQDFLEELSFPDTVQELEQGFERLFDEFLQRQQEHRLNRRDAKTTQVDDLIRERSADPNLSLRAIADEVSLSSDYLGRLYRSETGVSVAEAINHVRLENAKRLLKGTSMPVNEIARTVGFANENYFHPLFKKHQGLTPAEYRKKD